MNKLEKIRSMSEQLTGKYILVTQKLENFEELLVKNLSGQNIGGHSIEVKLEDTGEDEWIYGYMFYDQESLKVAVRSTFEDYLDSTNKVPNEHRSYNLHDLKDVPNHWKIALSSDKVLDSLIKRIERNLSIYLNEADRAHSSLENLFSAEAAQIDASVKEALKGHEHLLRQWIKARASVFTDPADSITRSSSYLESICRLIIEEKGLELPTKKDMTSLINAVVKEVDLSSYPEESQDVRQLVSGVKSTFSAIGAMRTHVGTAHGSSSNDKEPDAELAMLVNSSAAAVSMYVLSKSKV
ncbi:abortive infection family protein [Vibrio campbellii]|uniref:abortive infection family protein n=1 Tax=Vibrio campbellii TaxID=680 RepID=UPI00168D7D40|nr:abortive infection family protein [Vibrio campbellii]